MQGDLRKRGLKWNATSALGWTLLPQVKSTWNLEDKPEEPLGQVLRVSLKVDVCRSPVGLGQHTSLDQNQFSRTESTQDGPSERQRLWRPG